MKLLKSSPKCGIYTNLHICNSSFFIRRRFGENTNIWLRSVRISRSNGFKSTCESLSKDRCDLYASPLSRPNRQMSPRPTNLRQEVTSLSGIAERLSYLFRHLTRFCVKLSGLGANHHLTRVCGAIFCARKIFSGEWQLSGDNYSDMIRLFTSVVRYLFHSWFLYGDLTSILFSFGIIILQLINVYQLVEKFAQHVLWMKCFKNINKPRKNEITFVWIIKKVAASQQQY